ncbi:hypothetical protein [Streptomyces sp. NBC_00687]|uniref:hypothetical protein n=1 Tax=Streptomyces sp. NBC_00687 TaxID=2975807 RepID=UPI002253121F|nr:hypothetical protein [Streptomyces sp. NBC_00687]MCX4919986.1 hypothetical protein [Streptomyces sp. NBC_00687]
MALQHAHHLREAGQDWLLSCADDPAAVRSAWAADHLAVFTSGRHWTVAEAPLAQSMEAVKRIRPASRGPVLADVTAGRAWWLLPRELGDELDDIWHLAVQPAGWLLRCPPVLYPVRGRVWMEPPTGAGLLTDPSFLGAALGPGGSPRAVKEALG